MSKNKVLFLCKTPLQSLIAIQVIEMLSLDSYDVVYLTKNNTVIDQNYFKKISLKSNSNNSYYIHSYKVIKGLNSIIDIFKLTRLSKGLIQDSYQDIYVASFDNLFFRYILKKNPSAQLKSFDDGTANITPSSSYFNYDRRKQTVLLNKLLSVPSAKQVRRSIQKHYTIYNDFNNIVNKDKLVFTSLFQFNNTSNTSKNKNDLTIFIGQPFHEYLNAKEIQKLQYWLSSTHIDYYIKHPREGMPVVRNALIFDTKGLIAEEAIWELSKKNKVTIVSGYSTVLFNINTPNISKVYLSLSNHQDEEERINLIKRTNSKIIKV